MGQGPIHPLHSPKCCEGSNLLSVCFMCVSENLHGIRRCYKQAEITEVVHNATNITTTVQGRTYAFF